jgi:hypothetical protein
MILQVGELLCGCNGVDLWIYFFVFSATMLCIIFNM